MQSDSLQEEQVRNIQSMHAACIRLSKLNQALILLTKIDNQQFQQKDNINPGVIIHRLLDNYEELISAKQIQITTTINETTSLQMNEVMADILFSNLITNALKHNIDRGNITIALTPQQLIISNTGTDLETNPTELFERFKKGNQGSTSLGLGLSIVQKICDQNDFQAHYSYKDSIHKISIKF
jgi:signal transduction histidine kinase